MATLHPRESYDTGDLKALDRLVARHPNLVLGGDTASILRDCAFVVTQNSAVAFDGYLLGKPAVLFAQIDFHHIGLSAARLGAAQALAQVETHAPDFDRYLYWFLQDMAINASRPEALEEQIRAGASQVVDAVTDISAALREQGAASNEIARSVEHIAQMAEQNSAAVRDTANTAQRLEGLAQHLRDEVSHFHI